MSSRGATRSDCALLLCPMETIGLTTSVDHVTQLHAPCLVTEQGNSAEGSHLLKQFSLGWSPPVKCLNVLSASPFSVLKSSL